MRFLNLHYYKRYRMEIDLRRWSEPRQRDLLEYQFLPWSPELLDDHAETKYLSFRDEFDAVVFPCLGDFRSCRRLMTEIRDKQGFAPEATWLARYIGAGPERFENCGTIQAINIGRRRANIQNVGVTPLHRGRGVGAALVTNALIGLQQVGVLRVLLEVTAQNAPAVDLYQRLGFRRVRTLYKAVEQDYSGAVE